MKRLNFKHIIMGLAASSCLAFSSCTDLSETLYDDLKDRLLPNFVIFIGLGTAILT